MELLTEEKVLEEEREKAKKIRESMTGCGAMSSNTGGKYSGYSSKDKGGGGGSYGSYGNKDRQGGSSSYGSSSRND
jgi:epsin